MNNSNSYFNRSAIFTKSASFTKSTIAIALSTVIGLPNYVLAQESADAEEEDVEVIHVRGIKNSLIKSMNEKRFADSVTDSITATDIGKLPDVTIADSLQRITGVQINRSGGEGSSVNIRGIRQVATTLNGENMLSAGSVTTVQPNFSDVPSTMVSGLEVLKSTQAKNLAGGLSGVIDLKTYRPFDLEDGITLNAKLEATDGSMGDETDSGASAFFGYNKESDWGFTINISKSETNLADYVVGSTGTDWGFIAQEATGFVQDNVDVTYDGDSDDAFYAFQGHQASNQFIERDRSGINGSFQWQINDSFKITGDVFYTEMTELRKQAGFIASQSWQSTVGWFTPTQSGFIAHENLNTIEGEIVAQQGNFYSFSAGTLQARRTMTHSEADAIDKEAFNSNIEIEFDNGGDFSGTFRWVHGEARNDNALSVVDSYINSGSQVGATFKGPGGEVVGDVNPWGYDGQLAQLPDGTEVDDFTMIPIGIAYTGDTQVWNLPTTLFIDGEQVNETLGSNLARYSNTSTNLTGNLRDADMDVWRFDGTYMLDFEAIPSIDFGVRYGEREIQRDGWIGGVARTNAYGDAFLSRWKDSASQAPETGESFIAPISFVELNDRGMIAQISDFQGTSGLGGLYFVDPEAMADPLAWHNEVYGVNIQSPDGANSYDLTEQVTSAYFQANLDTEVSGYRVKGNVGLRYVKTEFDINQSELATNGQATYNGVTYILDGALGMLPPAAAIVNTKRDYTDVLPAVNLSTELNDDMILRFSYNKTLTSHDADDLARGINVTRILACDLQKDDGTAIFCATQATQQGNPQLEPWRSNNYDLSFEWYFNESSMLSVAAFYIDIETFIENTTVRLELPDSDGVVRGYNPTTGEFEGSTPTTTRGNGEGGKIKGIEVGYQQSFDFLPGIWSGLGMTANYTYSPSESGRRDYYGNDTPMIDNSEHQANLALWYEDEQLQARIAANYRSETFVSVRSMDPYFFAQFIEPTLYLDASVSYDFNEQFTISLQGTNLTEESRNQYYQWEDLVDKRWHNERRLTLGLQYRM